MRLLTAVVGLWLAVGPAAFVVCAVTGALLCDASLAALHADPYHPGDFSFGGGCFSALCSLPASLYAVWWFVRACRRSELPLKGTGQRVRWLFGVFALAALASVAVGVAFMFLCGLPGWERISASGPTPTQTAPA